MSANDTPPPATYDSAFLKACRREPVPHTPVWFMRQAGRSLPEYRKVREGAPMPESCQRPALVTEITLQPVTRSSGAAAVIWLGAQSARNRLFGELKAAGMDRTYLIGDAYAPRRLPIALFEAQTVARAV